MPEGFYTWIILIALIFIAFVVALAIFERKKKRATWLKIGARNDAYECSLCGINVRHQSEFCPCCGHPTNFKRRK